MSRFIQKGNNEATELDGEWIILSTDNYTITKLNEVGWGCWSMLEESQTADSIAESLVKRYELEENEEQVKKDVQDFLSSLFDCGLIKKC